MNQIKINIGNFKFHNKEVLFLQRHVWDKYLDKQKKVVDRARLMVADLSMHKSLGLSYSVDSLDLPLSFYPFNSEEIFSFGVTDGSYEAAEQTFVVHISANRDRFKYRPKDMEGVDTILQALGGFEKEHKGRKYILGANRVMETLAIDTDLADPDIKLPLVDLETLTNGLRYFIQDMRGLTQGTAQVWKDHLSIYLEIANQELGDFYVHIALANPNS